MHFKYLWIREKRVKGGGRERISLFIASLGNGQQ
jgi:hypothetical protein